MLQINRPEHSGSHYEYSRQRSHNANEIKNGEERFMHNTSNEYTILNKEL